MIRKATEKDVSAVAQIYDDIHTAEEKGLLTTGWLRNIYPVRETARKAVLNDELFVLEEDEMIFASARINRHQEPEYARVNWLYGAEDNEVEDTEYWNVLNIAGDGVMGYVSIPKINIKLAIYHGTKEDVLQTGVGHLNGTKLPIGGETTHSVLSAHRGLPSARLFTDIDQLKKGDMFYIHVLDEVLAYQVDQISDMVDKDDRDLLESLLQVEEGKDQVTLFTCTPYGVNSHRLLVRGTRVPYEGEEHVEMTVPETMVQAVQNYYMIYLILGLSITLLVIIIMKSVFKRKDNNNKQMKE